MLRFVPDEPAELGRSVLGIPFEPRVHDKRVIVCSHTDDQIAQGAMRAVPTLAYRGTLEAGQLPAVQHYADTARGGQRRRRRE